MELHFFSILAVYAASVLGAMGLGGGSLLMLYLLFFTDLPQQEAQALNLFLFLPTAALSAVLHRKNVSLRAGYPVYHERMTYFGAERCGVRDTIHRCSFECLASFSSSEKNIRTVPASHGQQGSIDTVSGTKTFP